MFSLSLSKKVGLAIVSLLSFSSCCHKISDTVTVDVYITKVLYANHNEPNMNHWVVYNTGKDYLHTSAAFFTVDMRNIVLNNRVWYRTKTFPRELKGKSKLGSLKMNRNIEIDTVYNLYNEHSRNNK